ncbi:glycoside-pentoside-hexuronide (GPH):cation symporter [Listeria booriae]|uniref:glycoside-pentoside-hexuronide (GPH):cation symporter n=1 Tax=Listeria booriae TaxID=1552123 RepID=UPI00162741F6|nr:glycoside-pentoside-hexuronide (GPH):cation symporter [Listeria booriae]MBC1800142.1 MFS transporter [Listeria booriae]
MEATGRMTAEQPLKAMVPWKERISYGLSDTACNLAFQVISTYLMFFYTDVYGISAAAVGTLFLVARVIDAFDGPIIGIFIDRTNTRWGKSRPFFLWFAIPFGLMCVLTFTTPGFGDAGKIAWAYVTYILVGILYSCVNLPITSILPSLTNNPKERTVLGTVRQFGGTLGQIIVTVFTLPIVAALGKGNDQKGFFLTILIFSIIAVVLLLNTFFNTKERIENVQKVVRVKDSVKAMKRNWSWIIMILMNFIYWMAMTMKNQTTVYFFKYNLGREDLVPMIMALAFGSLLTLLMTPAVAGKLGKRNTMVGGLILAIIGQVIMGVGAHSLSVPIIIVGVVINAFGTGFISGLLSVMLADTVDYGEWKSGVRAQGLLTSASSFGAKFGMGIGGAMTAGILAAGGYQANKTQTAAALQSIEFNFIWIPIIGFVIAGIALFFYKADKLEKMYLVELAERNRNLKNQE